ncbi:unnamed protein product, partial [Symbiodinium sp. KB8]
VNNDSGDGPKLYGLTREGKHVARLRIENSRANDWEDVAIGPGPREGKSYIYVGDVGDNRRQRGTVQIYRVEEPAIPNGRGRNDDIVVRAERFDVTYPDGMKYDCEAKTTAARPPPDLKDRFDRFGRPSHQMDSLRAELNALKQKSMYKENIAACISELESFKGEAAKRLAILEALKSSTSATPRAKDKGYGYRPNIDKALEEVTRMTKKLVQFLDSYDFLMQVLERGDVFYVDLPARGSRLNFVKTSVRINVDFATGADITPQGNVIAIRSYGNVLMWPRPCQWTIEDSMSRDPCYVDKKNERFGKDGDHYITISEGNKPPVWWFAMTRKFQQEMMSSVALLDISGPGSKGALVPIEPRIANVCPATGGAEWKGKVWSTDINECSGLAASRLKEDVYWINNDSGDGPMLYAINLRGDELATIKVVNVEWANDWEDVAMGPGPEQGSYIYVADTGDNYRNRWEGVQIYRFKEPPIQDNRYIEVSADRFDIKYPSGPYDCEAVFVDQRSNGRVYVITKGDNKNSDPRWRGGDLFYIDLPAQPANDLTFQETGLRIPVEWATGADMTPNGGIISIRSYGNVLMWPRNDWESVEQSMAKD